MTIFNVFSLLGGLALFLFGMDIMGKALEKQAGGQLQKILSKLTDNPLKGFFLGLCVTAVIQSSSATTVMVVGFVNSGIMELHQAIGVIMGSNVGTTVTSWILSLSGLQGDSLLINLLKPTSFSPLLAFIGILLYMCKSEKKKGVGTILIGFAVLMTGMTTMSNAVLPLQNEAWFTSLFTRFSNPLLGVLVGALVTGIIQSSSASVGILQALSATGVITYGSAIPIIMGQNIGTCVTALLSSVGANKNARRAAMVHLYFNIIGVTIFLFGFYGLNAVCHFAFVNTTIEAWGIAIVHSVFNILATVILLPFATGLEKLAILTIPDSPEKEEFALLDDRLLNTPAVAVERARAATAEMAELARVGVVQAMSLTHEWNDELAQKVRDEECRVDRYEDALGTYLVKLSGRELNHTDSQSVNTLLHTISDFERISDHSVNLLESAEEMHTKDIQFSQDARDELQVLEDAVLYMRLYFGGVLFSVVYNMTAGILNAAGNSRRSLVYLAWASVTNIVLDFVFIVGLRMGVAGAAIATDLSQLVSCVLSLRFLMKSEDACRVELSAIRLHRKMAGRIIRVGLPTGIQNMVISFSNVLVQASVNSYGAAAMAGFAAYMKIDGFNILPVSSISMAATTFVGQNYGAGRLDRVKRSVWVTLAIGVIYTLCTGAALLAGQDAILHLFTADEAVVTYGKLAMRWFCPFYFLLSILHGLAGAVRGTGASIPPMVVLLISLCLFRIVWIQFALPLFAGIEGVLLVYPVSWAVGAVLMVLYAWKGKWMQLPEAIS